MQRIGCWCVAVHIFGNQCFNFYLLVQFASYVVLLLLNRLNV
jgi:hypothetical protein